jgi:putative FmdB family regulatory protein
MPIYEYRCDKCGSHIEVIQKISDPPLKRCSKCRGKLEKTLSRTSFQFKGSGWYVTDYSRKKEPAGANESAAKTKTEKKPEKKAEPAASTATASDGD